MINPDRHVLICVKSLGLKNKVTLEIRVAPQKAKTLDDIACVKLQDFTTLYDLLTFELGPSRQLIVDDSVEFS